MHIVLTGWKNHYEIPHPRYFKIPYSSHSSPNELIQFVHSLNPKNIIYNDFKEKYKLDNARMDF